MWMKPSQPCYSVCNYYKGTVLQRALRNAASPPSAQVDLSCLHHRGQLQFAAESELVSQAIVSIQLHTRALSTFLLGAGGKLAAEGN